MQGTQTGRGTAGWPEEPDGRLVLRVQAKGALTQAAKAGRGSKGEGEGPGAFAEAWARTAFLVWEEFKR